MFGGIMNVDEVLNFALDNGASDIHISAGEPPILRIDGEMRRMKVDPITPEQSKEMVLSIMTDAVKAEFDENWECDFAIERPRSRFRVNAFTKMKTAAAVLRTIPTEILTLEQINAPKVFYDLTEHKNGLVLVTGPTGSGKSTTMAAMINHINETRREHILTLEDPVEFVHPNKMSIVSQREIHNDSKSFTAALTSALREDPDIILVGEMRDLETIRLALSAAETGHLVFGTLHTNSAIKTVDRLIDVFPSEEKDLIRMMLSESLRGVVAQNLLKGKHGGRVAAHEILLINQAASANIRKNETIQLKSVIQMGKKKGMQGWSDCLEDLITSDKIDQSAASMLLNSLEK